MINVTENIQVFEIWKVKSLFAIKIYVMFLIEVNKVKGSFSISICLDL